MRNLSQHIHPQGSGASICEACGAQFNCGVQLSSCWCSEVELGEADRADLRRRYQRCLCRVCLESIAEGEKKAVEEHHG